VPRTPLLARVVAACRVAARAAETRIRADELVTDLVAPNKPSPITRRRFVGAAAAGTAGAALAACTGPERTFGLFPGASNATKAPSGERVVVIGAGLAGLTCAYRLRQRGIDVTLYEATRG